MHQGIEVNFDDDFIAAANHVLNEYLSKPYKDGFHDLGRMRGVQHQYIERPNHGLVHALRKTAYIPVYVKLLKERYPEPMKQIDDNELKKIMIAQLFQVAGRESEGNAKRREYREASAIYFERYAKKNLGHLYSAKDIQKYRAIIAEGDNNKYKESFEMRIMRKVHALELMRLHQGDFLFHKPKPNTKDYSGLGRGLQDEFKSGEKAVGFVKYITDLFEATGDAVPLLEIKPGHEYDKFVGNQLVHFKNPGDTPKFFRAGVESDVVLFEQCQMSVEKGLAQILSVKPPFGLTYTIKGQAVEINKKPSQPIKQPKQPSRQNLPKDNALAKQRNELNEKIQLHEEFLKILPEDKNDPERLRVEKALVQLQLELKSIREEKPRVGKINPLARHYEIMQEQVQLHGNLIKDKVRIPGDGNCCFNAALVAAKHAGVQLPQGINNHYDLRKEVITRIREKHRVNKEIYDDYLPTFNKTGLHPAPHDQERYVAFMHAKGELEIFPDNFEAYIDRMSQLETWGGALELGVISEILQVEIQDHTVEFDLPIEIGNDKGYEKVIHLEHSGDHYNFYVDHGSWQGLDDNDPILAFDRQYKDIYIHELMKHLQQKNKHLKEQIEIKSSKHSKVTQNQIPITYENYIQYSDMLNKSAIEISKCLNQLEMVNLEQSDREAILKQLAKHRAQYKNYESTLGEIKQNFQAKGINEKLRKRLDELMLAYEANIKSLQQSQYNIILLTQDLNRVRESKGDASLEYKQLSEKIGTLIDDYKKNVEIARKAFNLQAREISFILREIPAHDKLNHVKAKFLQLNVSAKRAVRDERETFKEINVADSSVAYTHLKQFLKNKHNEKLSLRENIKQFFQDENVRAMLFNGGPIGGIDAIGPNAIWPYKLKHGKEQPMNVAGYKDNNLGEYNDEIINHLTEQLAQMVEAELKYPNRYPLYSSMNANLAVGNDVIKELSSVLLGQDYEAMFRLFSAGFEYENAESFRQKIYDQEGLRDDVSEFHKLATCCGISPFQCLQNESPLDFWSHDRNIQSFDRWKFEIWPKLSQVSDDPSLLKALEQKYKTLTELSGQLGGRMTQFLMSDKDIDQYSWISGAYGIKLPSVAHTIQGAVKTDRMSLAMDYYQENPEEFIQQNKIKRDNGLKQVKHKKISSQKDRNEVVDPSYKHVDDKMLGQMQARLYLHPDLFEPGRMRVNTYYSKQPDPKLLDEYQRQLKAFTQQLCALVISAKSRKQLKHQEVPKELQQSIVAFRPFKYLDTEKQKEVNKLLKGLISDSSEEQENKVIASENYQNLLKTLKNHKSVVQKLNAIDTVLKGLSAQEKQARLSEYLYYSIITGQKSIFDDLYAYYNSTHYDSKKFNIDFNKLSNGVETNKAFILAAKYNQTDMINMLIKMREQQSGLKTVSWLKGQIHIQRTGGEESTGNTPLHYLAQNGNTAAFMNLVNSISKARNYSSYVYNLGLIQNQQENTPLHILAFNDPQYGEDRRITLKTLLSDENSKAFDLLFGKAAITALNRNGLSPIMVAALSQNVEAVQRLGQKAGLSSNQLNLYLWVSMSPGDRMPAIQKNIKDFGEVPGFVLANWQIPKQFQDVEVEAQSQDYAKPLTINALKDNLDNALKEMDNQIQIQDAYIELKSALLDEKTTAYINELFEGYSESNHNLALENLGHLCNQNKIDIKYQPANAQTPLIKAAKEGNMKGVMVLLDAKETFRTQRTAKDEQGNTAFHYLAKRKDSGQAIVALLNKRSWSQNISAKSNPSQIKDNDGNTPVHIIVQLGHKAILDLIDEAFGSKGWVSRSDVSGLYQQLYYASFETNHDGLTPMMIACLEHPELIKHMAKALGLQSKDIQKFEAFSNAFIENNKAAMHVAINNLKDVPGWNNQYTSEQALGYKQQQQIKQQLNF